MMIPNDNLLRLHGELVSDCLSANVHQVHDYIVGPYAVTLRLSSQSGLNQAVQRCFGTHTRNALMDYSLMSNVLRSNAAVR